MRNYLNIGCTPTEEDCFPCASPLQRAETQIYRDQLRRAFPNGEFSVKGFSHDFGTYYEVVGWYDDEDKTEEGVKATFAAWKAEQDSPMYWDAQALPLVLELRERA